MAERRRHATYDEVFAIRTRLGEVLRPIEGEQGLVEYTGRHSDASIARAMKVPKGAVTKARKEKFGNIKVYREPNVVKPLTGNLLDQAWRISVDTSFEHFAKRLERLAVVTDARIKDIVVHVEELRDQMEIVQAELKVVRESHNRLADALGDENFRVAAGGRQLKVINR